MLFTILPTIGITFISSRFAQVATFNAVLQLVVFVITCNIPAFLTGRMSYVDIAWPWGLVSIGLLPVLVEGSNPGIRTKLAMAAFLAAGLRMAFGGAMLLFKGHLSQELPRYLYLRKIWAKNGIKDEKSLAYKLQMQKEIFVQCLANIGGLSFPLLIQAFGYKTGDLTLIEKFGWILWLASLAFEHTADLQKKQFVRECIEKKVKGTVCDIGLWRYSRHPNYFGEWMVWNSLIITSIPSVEALWQTTEETLVVKIGMTYGLIMVSYMMYQCLVNYTGAVPAEYFTVQKRPDYVQYQKMVNMFFPGPRKTATD